MNSFRSSGRAEGQAPRNNDSADLPPPDRDPDRHFSRFGWLVFLDRVPREVQTAGRTGRHAHLVTLCVWTARIWDWPRRRSGQAKDAPLSITGPAGRGAAAARAGQQRLAGSEVDSGPKRITAVRRTGVGVAEVAHTLSSS